jgi:hypothetical protein
MQVMKEGSDKDIEILEKKIEILEMKSSNKSSKKLS